VALRAAREDAIEQLSDAFARDVITLEAFEQRVDQAFACQQVADFDGLVRDLGPRHAQALARVERALPVPVSESVARVERVALSVLGNVERRGRWSLPRYGRALSVLGNIELDMRDVVFPPGVTELVVNAVFGNVEIVVPPELAVETSGSGILGSFASMCRVPRDLGGEPLLRIRGSAVFGNVEIRTWPRALPERR
jgi:hypothetical protein